jgi:hypothetical protein
MEACETCRFRDGPLDSTVFNWTRSGVRVGRLNLRVRSRLRYAVNLGSSRQRAMAGDSHAPAKNKTTEPTLSICQIIQVIADFDVAEAWAVRFLTLVDELYDDLIVWLSDGEGSLSELQERIDLLLRMSDDVSVEFGEAAKDFHVAYLSFGAIKDAQTTKTKGLAPAQPHLNLFGCCLTWLSGRLANWLRLDS